MKTKKKKDSPSTKTMKLVRTTVKTTGFMTTKTPCSITRKKTRKKYHWCMKANCCCQNRRRFQKTTMKMIMEPVLRTSMVNAEVTRILTLEEDLRIV